MRRRVSRRPVARRSPRRQRARSTCVPRPRSRRADPAWTRTSGRGSAVTRPPAARPRTGSASSCRCGRAPQRSRPGCAGASSCRPRLHPSTQLYKIPPKCHAKSVTAAPVQAREYSPVDITSQDFWSRPFAARDEMFARLRAGDGLTWHRPFESMFPMEEPGFWALTRRADIAFVSQHPELFTSARGGGAQSDARRDPADRVVLPEHGSAAAHRLPTADQLGVHAAKRAPDRRADPQATPSPSSTTSSVRATSSSSPPARRGCRC